VVRLRARGVATRASVHISLTFSSTMLQWRSKAFTRPSSLRLLRQLMSTWAGVVGSGARTHTA
jgi:hypothetical protein